MAILENVDGKTFRLSFVLRLEKIGKTLYLTFFVYLFQFPISGHVVWDTKYIDIYIFKYPCWPVGQSSKVWNGLSVLDSILIIKLKGTHSS